MTYRIALERLRAYEPRELIGGTYRSYDGCHCAIGALAPSTAYATDSIVDLARDVHSVRLELRALHLSTVEAEVLQRTNDSFKGERAERYAHVLAWLETQVAKETSDGR